MSNQLIYQVKYVVMGTNNELDNSFLSSTGARSGHRQKGKKENQLDIMSLFVLKKRIITTQKDFDRGQF